MTQNKQGDYVGKASDWITLKQHWCGAGWLSEEHPGEGAFYGPKIDIKLVDVLGRLWQLSTVQLNNPAAAV